MENNLNEISNNLSKSLEGFTAQLPKLTDYLTQMITNNPQLGVEYKKVLKDTDIQSKVNDLQKKIKEVNHTFRK